MKIPKHLAQVADLYYTTRAKRLDAEKVAKKIEEDEKALKEYLINNLPKSQAGGIAGKICRVEIKKTPVPIIADEKKFYKFAARKGNEDLLKHSLNVAAIRERWDEKKVIPGIETFNQVGLSYSKL
jgi:hypothetical protein